MGNATWYDVEPRDFADAVFDYYSIPAYGLATEADGSMRQGKLARWKSVKQTGDQFTWFDVRLLSRRYGCCISEAQ